MHDMGRFVALSLVFATGPAFAARVPLCTESAKTFLPCELSFELPRSAVANNSVYKDEILSVEFRSPNHLTYALPAFSDTGHTLIVRFSPTEPGQWTYHVSSALKPLDNQESTFNVLDSGLPGFVGVANLRHWWTTNKQPHLWLAAAVPMLQTDQTSLESWLDARKQDGFTHVRATLLTLKTTMKPMDSDKSPNAAYFAVLDDRILAAAERGFTLDLVLADDSFLRSGAFDSYDERNALIRYIVARYGGLNVTWQGIEKYEDVPNGRALLKDMNASIAKYDGFRHPRSTDARNSSSPLVGDGWMNYLLEAVENPQFGAVEHQFTTEPEIHIVDATDPDSFRHQLWSCTTNGEYPSISYASLENPANVSAVRTWVKIISDTRHWEFEPYFNVDGARAVGLEEIGYIAYAQNPGIVEINFDKHKYTPIWINPLTGEEVVEKNWRGDVFSRPTPDNSHDWILDIEREGHKEAMLRSVRFESVEAPVQEIESDSSKVPFDVADPQGDQIDTSKPAKFTIKVMRANRASRTMQFVWWGEVVANGSGTRLLGVGSNGNLTFSKDLLKQPGQTLSLRIEAINAYGKAYELDKVYQLTP